LQWLPLEGKLSAEQTDEVKKPIKPVCSSNAHTTSGRPMGGHLLLKEKAA